MQSTITLSFVAAARDEEDEEEEEERSGFVRALTTAALRSSREAGATRPKASAKDA
jgi:hypothetical protein